MKKITPLFLLFLTPLLALAQYTTPNTGVNYDLNDLVTESPSTISFDGSEYTLVADLTISANDSFSITTAETLKIAADVRITVDGIFTADAGSDEIIITAIDQNAPYDGFRFEDTSTVTIQNANISYGGGLKTVTPNFSITNSTLINNVSGVSTGAVISLSAGSPLIENNEFLFNDLPAVGSGANQQVSAQIINNYLEFNGQSNQNRPQLNMGPTGADTLRIVQNTIIGDPAMDKVGGIGVSNFIGGQIVAIIDDNTVVDNRYGMTVAGGNAFAYIRNNIIEDNNTQGNPNLGGSGISLNSSSNTQNIIATGNEIRGNLWGITVIGEASINLGDDADNPGENVFANNENGGETFALYNNTPHTIMAKNNCWIEGIENTSADAESVIFHQADDATLGEVIYDPVGCQDLGIDQATQVALRIYPNPTSKSLHFESTANFERVEIYSLQGKLVQEKLLNNNENSFPIQLGAGVYLVKFGNQNQQITKKLIVE
ncbi:T9SS type A sorting domain-containing protein [Haloflavibacter putidus]|uniref:T9SS type A sorting domain-containing protein n=1 Tax=Haloflavibacter putidus TaxID=2576776 RepID=A0A507ZNJ4_9FLAO|nr:T9SS type A sorting domain-containing protein [Haloflavibacter putidus]TQD38859.1 T9SS type A sorting domain-containing protein [Haloflavibacter putidus]